MKEAKYRPCLQAEQSTPLGNRASSKYCFLIIEQKGPWKEGRVQVALAYDFREIPGFPVSGLKELPVLGRVEEQGQRKATGIDATESTAIYSAAHEFLEELFLEYLFASESDLGSDCEGGFCKGIG